MKKRITMLIICILMVTMLMPMSVSADIGPKPSVHINFMDIGDELCYGTLLSKVKSTGPSYVWDGNPDYMRLGNLDIETWQVFVDYEDEDGFYFLQESWICSDSESLDWTYYPPAEFKVLLYYPETDTFVTSEIYERYAFDSYFIATMNEAGTGLNLVKSYDHSLEILGLVCRIIITIIAELGVALLFGFARKNLITVILKVNVVTQIILNVVLYIINYNQGGFAFIFYYFILEFLVFVAEYLAYRTIFAKKEGIRISKKKILAYAFTANAGSLIVGIWISSLIPQIF